jgi:phosphate transport system substrate-binding protein
MRLGVNSGFRFVLARAGLAITVGAAMVSAGAVARGARDTLSGQGSSLVAPLLAAWNTDYSARAGTSIAYVSSGSSAGVAAITARAVDFGASDAPLTPDQFTAAKGVVQIPWALTATALSYNITGVAGGLRLTSAAIAGIYLGTIQYWDATVLTKLNPRLKLPHEKITPVFRSDGSGDTFAFTTYLAKTSPRWKSKVGSGSQVNFPPGKPAKGNSGVASAIDTTTGAIGYLSVAYALTNNLPVTAIKNRAGRFPTPGIRAIAAAASTVTRVPADNAVSILDPPASAPQAYPISTFTYVIVPTQTAKATALTRFIFYGLTAGQAFGPKLGFAPIPRIILSAGERTLLQVKPA